MTPYVLRETVTNIYQIPEKIQWLAQCAHFDLYHGPRETLEDDPYPYSFTSATGEISEWANENIADLWYDEDSGYLMDEEPEFEGADLGSIYYIKAYEQKVILFGKELARYL